MLDAKSRFAQWQTINKEMNGFPAGLIGFASGSQPSQTQQSIK